MRTSNRFVLPGVWCEVCTAPEAEPGAVVRRAGRVTGSAEAAIRWMRAGVRAVACTLGPLQAAYVLDHWAHGSGSLDDYDRLRRGRACKLTVHRAGQRITWRAAPVRLVRLAEADGRPPCGDHCPAPRQEAGRER